ncbi:hypothetical protein DVQ33_22180 [Yersinia enterocolitica]|uniref:Uncharacterized protein n=1 Tax=Yersinia enterocolitica TaxID=630 RepID=A0A9P1Q031_YEREN|nr:hypothetical protein [Yersinia enterocolitica]CCQ40491.1 hypothetical protein YE5303_17931 [Yersinia enterocolitica (type O:5) str. YE53/03]EKN5022064.1 hypothetical protein [Yersinia enterocolitica]EKN5032384.1 hypothetical protein [Yersinia enterocolitica]EKN5043715.1 hypothetical protein [Yersinia enterocolitica]
MERRSVPLGIRILITIALFVLSFIVLRPSTPVTQREYDFWNAAANFFGEYDVEGFVGVALLISCTIISFVCYKIVIRVAERRMNRCR